MSAKRSTNPFNSGLTACLLALASLCCSIGPAQAGKPIVLLDSFHAHNFVDRGLTPGEHSYHHITGLRRAMGMLTDRQVEVHEMIVGPITSEKLKDVQLIILNLPSMDRPPWLTSEMDAVEKFIRGGGGMIFITDHSNCYYHQYHLLPLWQRLRLMPTFETACERTARNKLARRGPAWLLVREFEKHPVTDQVNFLATQTGGRVVGDGVIARTSDDAWADEGISPLYGEGNPGLLGDLQWSQSEESGPQGIVLARAIDRGRVVVISDQNALGDAQISYADNWRLWLNACNWAGRLNVPTTALSVDQILLGRHTPKSSETPREVPTFEQLIGSEPNRNAWPTLPPGSWQAECWEPLTRGTFHWGGTDEDQLYHFWCWLNRWCWASAHEQPSNPAPQGRLLLLARQADLSDAGLQKRLAEVLRQQGKFILLSTVNAAPAADDPQRLAWARSQLLPYLAEDIRRQLTSDGSAHDQPLRHVQFTAGAARLVVVLDTAALENASFLAPEIAPNAPQSKWQRQLYHWLFEQP